MAPRTTPKCAVCNNNEFKYTCPVCPALYCSVKCFKDHKAASCVSSSTSAPGIEARTSSAQEAPSKSEAPEHATESVPVPPPAEDEPLSEPTPLRPLTTLRWPYIPDESAYPDPLKRDDPKTLQLPQYEAIATSPDIRTLLAAHPRLRTLLTSLDSLRGPDREHAFQRALGVDVSGGALAGADASLARPAGFGGGWRDRGQAGPLADVDPEDLAAFRQLAEAIECAVRARSAEHQQRVQQGVLGLDWEDAVS